jgi:hypothetical protein
MRGTTAKRLRKFAELLIQNSTPEELAGKDKHRITNELKVYWKEKGKEGQKFVRHALAGNLK